jgi:hypothetical protein
MLMVIVPKVLAFVLIVTLSFTGFGNIANESKSTIVTERVSSTNSVSKILVIIGELKSKNIDASFGIIRPIAYPDFSLILQYTKFLLPLAHLVLLVN